ncbi:MAG: hypothetical protein H7249_06025 [Chitinophagaceae bacterium]|nr:hypothetical protein [Oligoflexus sp.]
MNFALLVEKISEQDTQKLSVRQSLSEQMVPEMQKALNDLKKKTGVFAFRITMDEFEADEGYECDFQVKWALSEDWRSFDGNVPPRFAKFRDEIYEVSDAMDTIAPIICKKLKLSSETDLHS